jgi:hypothetical protein
LTRLLSALIFEYHFSHAEVLALPLAAAIRYLHCIREKYQQEEGNQTQANAEIVSGLDFGDNAITGWID